MYFHGKLSAFKINNYKINNYKINNYKIGRYKINGGFSTTYDYTIPTTVVASAYDTSAAARPQRLSNGWWVCCAYDSTGGQIRFYKWQPPYAVGTWSQLCYRTFGSACNVSLISHDTTVYALITYSHSGSHVYWVGFDAATQTNIDLTLNDNIESGQTSIGLISSIAIDSSGNLTAAWASKNSTYPDSFNIRSAKSPDGGTTWTKQDGTAGVDQMTTENSAGAQHYNPCVIYMSNSNPAITEDYVNGGIYRIRCIAWNGSAWNSFVTVYYGDTYAQSSPSAVVQKYGTYAGNIGVAWHGYGATHTTTYHILFKSSSDNGANWGSLIDVAVGQNATLTCDQSGNYHVTYERSSVIYRKSSSDGGATWSAEVIVGLKAPSGNWLYPSAVGTKIYCKQVASPYKMWIYDTVTDTWDESSGGTPSGDWNYPVAVGTKIYYKQVASPYKMWIYDTTTDTWDESSGGTPSGDWDYPAAVGTKIYCRQVASPYKMWIYDTVTDTWDESSGGTPSGAWIYPVAVGTKIYCRQSASPYKMWIYDTTTDTWDESSGGTPSGNRTYAAAVGTKIYCRQSASPYKAWIYDTTTDTWDESSGGTPSGDWSYAAAVGTKIYCRQSASPYKVFAYDTETNIWIDSGGTNPSSCDNYFNFEKPITIFKDASSVRFTGKFTVED
jgi:hypothetical protein